MSPTAFTSTSTSSTAPSASGTASHHAALHQAPTAHPHLAHPAAPAAGETGQTGQISRVEQRDPLQARYEIDAKLPRELREESRGMDWGLFMATYAPEPTLKVTISGTTQKNWMMSEYAFDVLTMPKTSAATHTTETIEADGPVRAIGQVLNRHGRYIEILKFHQLEVFEATATVMKVGHSERDKVTHWVIGFGATPEASAAAAMSAGAQRVHGNV